MPLVVVGGALGTIAVGFPLRASRGRQLTAASGWVLALTLAALLHAGLIEGVVSNVLIAVGVTKLSCAVTLLTVIVASRTTNSEALEPSTTRSTTR